MDKIFTIAEIGINHNGDINIAKQLIKYSKEAGFDCVKFQKRTINTVYSQEILDSQRESPWGNTTRDQKEGLEFNHNDYLEIDKYCKELEIEWFASAWDQDSLLFLQNFNLTFNKIASAMIVDINFLKSVARQKKYTFISTGMSTKENIDTAVKIFRDENCRFELMHCVSTYPMPEAQANLNTIISLRELYNCNVGYSGHENGIAVSFAAAALGITSLERHITLDRAMYGSDQSASLEPVGFRNLIGGIRKIEKCFYGSEVGHIFAEEVAIANKLRSHIKID